MKIAVFHNLPDGGAKRYLYEIVNQLNTNGHSIDEYSISTSSTYKSLDKYISKKFIYTYNAKKFLLGVPDLLLNYKQLHKKIAQEIDSRNYDFVLANHDYLTKSPYILRYLNTESVYICHEPQREFYEDKKFLSPTIKSKLVNIIRYPIKYIDTANAKAATSIIANSKYSRGVLQQVYGHKKIAVAYPGVNKKIFSRSAHIKRTKSVLSIGSLSPIKGHDFLICSLGMLSPNIRPSAMIIGKGSKKEKDYLLHLAKNNNVKIKIYDHVSEKKLISLYHTSLFLAHCAYREPFGLTAIESISCNTPVIAIKEGGVAEIIKHGINGYLSKRNEKEFAGYMNIIINKPTNNISSTINKFTWKYCAKVIVNSVSSK